VAPVRFFRAVEKRTLQLGNLVAFDGAEKYPTLLPETSVFHAAPKVTPL
jgi:hypothetical protein